MMRAGVGARIVVCGHRAGWPDRECEVVEVRSASGRPPYVGRTVAVRVFSFLGRML
jgi:hypothetical protein